MEFNVYAETQEQADAASRAIRDFITANAQKGVAVTATKLTEAIARWSDSIIVSNYFKR